MNDLEFIIVNSNLPHSQAVLHELESRVSFPVYQDTMEKNIWKLMDGGKDDIYVYDRCGRLAYYIPYPLSIMNTDEALVASAILATYYRSPCGVTCDKSSNTSLEDILNARETTLVDITSTTEIYAETLDHNTELSNLSYPFEVTNITNLNEISTNESKESLNSDSDFNKFEYLDYEFDNDTNESYERNETKSVIKDEEKNSIYSIYFSKDASTNETENSEDTLSLNSTLEHVSNNSSSNNASTIVEQHHHHESNHSENSIDQGTVVRPPKRKSDRCAEADFSVCRNWSKRRLIRAHMCCSTPDPNATQRENKICRNFGKKRCKKLRTILKCCIKTAFIETTTTIAQNESEIALVTESTTVNNQVEEVTTETNAFARVNFNMVCCKNVEEGRSCRVVQAPPCDNDEYISDNVDLSEIKDFQPTL